MLFIGGFQLGLQELTEMHCFKACHLCLGNALVEWCDNRINIGIKEECTGVAFPARLIDNPVWR